MQLAIGELFLLAGLSAIGTIIEQNKSVQFYQDAYPSGANKVLGFLTYHWIFALQWDHIYTAPYFLGLMALLGASLAACTMTRQLPMVRVARRYTSISHPLGHLHDARHLPYPTPLQCKCYAVLALSKVSNMYLARQATRPSLSSIVHKCFAAHTLSCLINASVFANGCVVLFISILVFVTKACHKHCDMTRHCMHRWRFAQTPERIYNQGSAEVLPDADVKDLGRLLSQKGYQVFRQGPSLYAFKGLAGRLGPIGVHASMLAIMAGVAIGGLGGFKGSVMVPQGGDFLVAQVKCISNNKS